MAVMQTDNSKRNDGTGPLQRLPAPPTDFRGRAAELRELKAAFNARRAKIFNLHGVAGVGKTALALAVAHELAEQFLDAQFFIDRWETGEPRSAAGMMRQVIWTAQPATKLPEEDAGIQAAYAEVLRGRQTVVLVDGALTNKGLTSLVSGEGCLMIVTSRERLALPELFALKLDPLPQPDAEGLLLHLAPRVGKLAAELAELAGGLPLALHLVGGALAVMMDLDPADCADRLLAEQWEQS